MTIEWTEETGSRTEGKERMDLGKLEDQLEIQAARMQEQQVASDAEQQNKRE